MRRVERVLDVRQGELCWVAGTVYMDMPLKPNILDDISKDVSFIVVCGRQTPDKGLALDIRTTASREIHFSFRSRSDYAGR